LTLKQFVAMIGAFEDGLGARGAIKGIVDAVVSDPEPGGT
jgi:hypothetical protein